MSDTAPVIDREIPITTYSAIAAALTIISLLVYFKDPYSVLACVPGALVGWLIGVLLSPYEEERALFSGYAKSAAAFVTGFLVSKLDRIFELFMTSKTTSEVAPILNEGVWRPFIFGISSLILVLIYTYTCRHYGQRAIAEAKAAAKARLANGQSSSSNAAKSSSAANQPPPTTGA